VGDLPLALAVAAGTLAALNPCGFVLLPVYLSALILSGAPSRGRAVVRALVTAASVTAGFAAVFAVFGLALVPVADVVQRHLPWFTVALGLALLPVGAWLLAGREIPVLRWSGPGPALRGSAASMVAFGAAYALASLGCTVGPFLAIVVSAFRAGSTPDGIVLLLAYAAGMGLVVGTAALAVALTRTELIGRLRRLAPVVSRAGGAVVVIAGVYVAYYGWYELRLRRGGDAADPVVEAAAAVQGWIEQAVGWLGPIVLLAAFVAALAVAGLLVRGTRSPRS
jgi:cytochrome c biogenesis protein CcdA